MAIMGIPVRGAAEQTPQMAGPSPVPRVSEKADVSYYKRGDLRDTAIAEQQKPHRCETRAAREPGLRQH